MTLLKAVWQEAKNGQGAFVLIGGEPGVGKSRLVRELVETARSDGAATAISAAYEGEPGTGFEPVIELLRGLGRTAPASSKEAVAKALAALSEPRASDQGSFGRSSLFEEVLAAIETAAQDATGVLLIIEDLHWSDQSTSRLLTYIARRSADLPLLVLATHRLVGPHPPDGLLDLGSEVRRLSNGVRLSMQPLTREESILLIESATQGALAPPVVERVVERSEGNPFLLEELLREALAARVQTPDELVVPAAVAEVMQQRLARLSPETSSVAAAAAVLGEVTSLARLAALQALERDQLLQAIDDLSAAGIFESADPQRIMFRHSLAREAVLKSVPLARRCDLHLQVAGLLEEETDGPAVIAAHLLASGRDDVRRRAADLFAAAATRSFDSLAFEDAVHYLETALALVRECGGDQPEELRLRLMLAEAHRRAGNIDSALAAFRTCADLAAGLGDPEQEAQAARGYEGTYVETDRPRSDSDAVSVQLLTRALDHLPEEQSGSRARVLSALANAEFFAGETTRAEQLSTGALELARDSGDMVALASALEAQRIVTWQPGEVERRLAIARELTDVAAAANFRERQLDGIYWQVACLMEMGSVEEASREIERYQALASELRSPTRLAISLRMQGMLALLSGNLEPGRELAEAALRQGLRAGSSDTPMHHLTQMLEVLEEGTDRELIEERLGDSRLWPPNPNRLSILSYLLARLGRLKEAEQTLSKVAAGGFAISRDWMHVPLLTLICDAVARIGRREWAGQIYELLLPYADQFVVNSNSICYGSVEFSLGLAASATGDARAEHHLRRAIERNSTIGAPVWVARSKQALAAWLLTQPGSTAEARQLIEDAALEFTSVGQPLSAEKARALTASAHTSPPGQVPAGLSAREVEVLRLVAEGCGNHEIADRLYLSLRTVERHVTNIYEKIGAAGRAEAIAFALRHDLTG